MKTRPFMFHGRCYRVLNTPGLITRIRLQDHKGFKYVVTPEELNEMIHGR